MYILIIKAAIKETCRTVAQEGIYFSTNRLYPSKHQLYHNLDLSFRCNLCYNQIKRNSRRDLMKLSFKKTVTVCLLLALVCIPHPAAAKEASRSAEAQRQPSSCYTTFLQLADTYTAAQENMATCFTLLLRNMTSATPNTEATTQSAPHPQQQTSAVEEEVSAAATYEEQVLELVNAERAKEGIAPLQMDEPLCRAAEIRAEECTESFSHTRPNGRSCFTVLQEVKATYSTAGENLAIGQKTPQETVAAWMESSGHRANIMNPNFRKLGVGITESTGRYTGYAWAQMFTD